MADGFGLEMRKIPLRLDSQTMSEDRAVSAELQGVGPWDQDWLSRHMG